MADQGELSKEQAEGDEPLRIDLRTPQEAYDSQKRSIASAMFARVLGDNERLMGGDYILEFNADIQAAYLSAAGAVMSNLGIHDPNAGEPGLRVLPGGAADGPAAMSQPEEAAVA